MFAQSVAVSNVCLQVVLGQALHQVDELLPSSSLPFDDIAAAILLVFFGVRTLQVRPCCWNKVAAADQTSTCLRNNFMLAVSSACFGIELYVAVSHMQGRAAYMWYDLSPVQEQQCMQEFAPAHMVHE